MEKFPLEHLFNPQKYLLIKGHCALKKDYKYLHTNYWGKWFSWSKLNKLCRHNYASYSNNTELTFAILYSKKQWAIHRCTIFYGIICGVPFLLKVTKSNILHWNLNNYLFNTSHRFVHPISLHILRFPIPAVLPQNVTNKNCLVWKGS